MDVLYYHPPLASGKITHPCNSRYHGKIFLYIIYSYKYLKSDLIKHCHVIFIHSLGQPLIVRSHSKVHPSRGNPKEISTWASRVSNYSYFPWFNRQQAWRFSQSRGYSITWCLIQKYSIYYTNYHSCWSVTRRFVSPRKVRSPEGDLTFLWETNRRVTLQQGW